MNGSTKIKQLFNREQFFFKAVPALVWQLLFFIIPIIFLLALSFFKNDADSFSLDAFTLDHYRELWKFPYLKIIIRSFFVALFTAVLCLLVGYPLTYYIALKKRAWKNIFLFFLVLPFVTNLLVLTYAWNFVLDKDGLLNQLLLTLHIIREPIIMLNSFFAIMVVMFYCYLPFMIMPLFTSLEKFDLTLIEASHDLGANQWQTFFKIIVPLTWPAIQIGFFLVFVPAFGEFVIPLLMGGDKYMFVGTVISHYFLIGQDRPVGAAFTLVISVLLCCILFCFMALSKKRTYGIQGRYDKVS
jgi:spermidine/putrescine transport system permease protein